MGLDVCNCPHARVFYFLFYLFHFFVTVKQTLMHTLGEYDHIATHMGIRRAWGGGGVARSSFAVSLQRPLELGAMGRRFSCSPSLRSWCARVLTGEER